MARVGSEARACGARPTHLSLSRRLARSSDMLGSTHKCGCKSTVEFGAFSPKEVCTRLNNNIYAPRWKRLLFFADYMASQPMPVAMGVPVQAVASPSPIPTAVPLGEAVPVAMPVSTAAANAVAPTPMSMQASASGFLRFPCSAETAVPLGEAVCSAETAVPLGGAVPVAMPVSMAAANAVAPTPMSMQAPASGFSRLPTLRFPCSTGKYEQLKAMTRADVPYALAARGMTQRQWTECTDALERVHDAQFFKNCPSAEACY